MKALSNNQVKNCIKEYRNGKEEYYEILLNNFNNQMFYILNKYNFSRLPYDKKDMEVELKLVLVKAMEEYDLNSEIDFHVYLFGLRTHRISRIFRKYAAQKRDHGIQYYLETQISEGSSLADVISDTTDFEEVYTRKIHYKQKIEEIKSILKPEEYEMYINVIRGMRIKDIAKIYNIDAIKMKSKLANIKRKIRKYIKY